MRKKSKEPVHPASPAVSRPGTARRLTFPGYASALEDLWASPQRLRYLRSLQPESRPLA